MELWIPGGQRDSYYLKRYNKPMPSRLNARPYALNGVLYIELCESSKGVWTGFRDPASLAMRLSKLKISFWDDIPRLPKDIDYVAKIVSELEKMGKSPERTPNPRPD